MRKNLSSLIIKTLQLNPNNPILGSKINNNWIWRDKKYILNSIHYCRDFLISENIQKGDRIAYKGANSIEWLSWNMACNSLGGIWVPMYENQSNEYCNHIIKDCSPKLLITNSKVDVPSTIVKTCYNDIEQLENDKKIDFIYNDISTLIYTSGTTGKPKGVMLSNENIISNINDIQVRFSDLKNSVSLNILPWAHIYSQTCELYYNILNENKIALATNRGTFIKELQEIQPDILYIVPRILELIKARVDKYDVFIVKYLLPLILTKVFGRNLKVMFVGGAKLQSSTKEFFTNQGYTICEGYGCTELSPMVSVNHMNNPRNLESIGKILDNVIVEIINDEIQVSGPNVMKGYWKNEKETKKVLIERNNKIWYKTGDSGYIKDDFLYYEGRISENYKLSNGKFVNVDYIESIVKEHVKCNCVVFTQDNIHNELIISREINHEFLELINRDLNNFLKIKKVYWLKESDWEEYFTPKMSIKRKKLIQDFKDNKMNVILLEDYN